MFLKKMKVSELKQEIRMVLKDFKGFSTMKKKDLIEVMLENEELFKHLDKSEAKPSEDKKEKKKIKSVSFEKPSDKKRAPSDYVKFIAKYRKENDLSLKQAMQEVKEKGLYVAKTPAKKQSKKEEPKKEEPKKEEPKKDPNSLSSMKSKLKDLTDLIDDLEITIDSFPKKLNKEEDKSKTKLVNKRAKLIDTEKKLKLEIRDKEDSGEVDDDKLDEFKKLVNKFIKKPSKKLYEDVNLDYDQADDLPEKLFDKLEQAMNKYEEGLKKPAPKKKQVNKKIEEPKKITYEYLENNKKRQTEYVLKVGRMMRKYNFLPVEDKRTSLNKKLKKEIEEHMKFIFNAPKSMREYLSEQFENKQKFEGQFEDDYDDFINPHWTQDPDGTRPKKEPKKETKKYRYSFDISPKEVQDDQMEMEDLVKKNKELLSNVYIARVGYKGEKLVRDMNFLLYLYKRASNNSGYTPKQKKQSSSHFLSRTKDLLKQLKNVKVGGEEANDKLFKIGELKVLVPVKK